MFTVISTVLARRHWPLLGVKVRVTVPLCPLGSKVLPLTPSPLHVPITPLCVVAKLMGVAMSQIGAKGFNGTVVGVFTVMSMVLSLAHCPAPTSKVNVIIPLNPLGSKLLPPTTPLLPVQVPVILLCVVLSVIGASEAQRVVGVTLSVGVVGAVTLIVVLLAAKHCPASGVNVSEIGPLNPEGLNELLDTLAPPVQFPETPPTLLPKEIGAANAQIALKGVKEIGGGVLTVTCCCAVAEQLLVSVTVTL